MRILRAHIDNKYNSALFIEKHKPTLERQNHCIFLLWTVQYVFNLVWETIRLSVTWFIPIATIYFIQIAWTTGIFQAKQAQLLVRTVEQNWLHFSLMKLMLRKSFKQILIFQMVHLFNRKHFRFQIIVVMNCIYKSCWEMK